MAFGLIRGHKVLMQWASGGKETTCAYVPFFHHWYKKWEVIHLVVACLRSRHKFATPRSRPLCSYYHSRSADRRRGTAAAIVTLSLHHGNTRTTLEDPRTAPHRCFDGKMEIRAMRLGSYREPALPFTVTCIDNAGGAANTPPSTKPIIALTPHATLAMPSGMDKRERNLKG